MIDENYIKELLRLKDDRLYHREGQELEFKEQFNLAGLAEYFRDFAAFANNHGGYLIFGVKDAPRIHIGLSDASKKQFDKVDPGKISGHLIEIYSSNITWEQATIGIGDLLFGIFHVSESNIKPIIAKKDEGKGQTIKNGEIYYRYGGRTQKILYAELESIINRRINQNNKQWLDLMAKIGRTGPQNAAILDTERAIIEKDDSKILVLDEGLANKLKFIKEGEFSEKNGGATLKLVGDVVPIDRVEVIKRVKENLIRLYPLSAMELADAVHMALPKAKRNDIWQTIRDNKIKDNPDYSAYNFRNKSLEDKYKKTKKMPSGTPSIYNSKAIDLIVKILKEAPNTLSA